MNKKERLKEGKNALIVGTVGNIFLTIFNIIVGITSGSYALISEGFHTLSDIITAIISYIGFKIGQKPADDDHHFGHGRYEAITGLIIVLFLAFVAYEVISGAIDRIFFNPSIEAPTYLAAIMAFIGIIVNILTSRYIISVGRKVNSPAIVADGNHQKVDIYSSFAILIGIILSQIGFPILDPVIGLVIGIIILKTAYEVGSENINNIMGKIPSKELVTDIEKSALSINGVYSAHNIKIGYFGTYAIISMHIDLDPNLKLVDSHEIVHKVQDKIQNDIEIIKSVTIHSCPYNVSYNHAQEIDK